MRRRNMYYATGQPGWMRFGYSPGWSGGRGGGFGPCAQYLLTGQWPTPQMAVAWQAMQAGGTMPQAAAATPQTGAATAATRLSLLQQQAQMLEQQLEQLRAQIAAIESQE